jgi:transposase
MVATKPVDFRRGADGLVALVRRLGRILSPEQFLFSARSEPTG